MKFKTEQFKRLCSIVLTALDSKANGALTLESKGGYLYINTAGVDYHLSARFVQDEQEQMKVAVQAALFLKLVADLDSDEIELRPCDYYLQIKAGSGRFKVPYVYANNEMADVRTITINNVVTEMNIDGDVLNSILTFNSKELVKKIWQRRDVQDMFFIDQQGCITFTNGACVNSFELEKPVKLLLKPQLVKLFKLFRGETVAFKLGYDEVGDGLIQTKVSFATEDITLTAITMLNEAVYLVQVGEDQIRGMCNKVFPYSVVVDTESLRKAVNRLLLFYKKEDQMRASASVQCDEASLSLVGAGDNVETVDVGAGSAIEGIYKMDLFLFDLKLILDTCAEPTITLNFGDRRMIVVSRGNIKNIIPEKASDNGA